MGLSSVMQTALSGFNAATAMIDVTGNNLANQNTNGFKASSVSLATQTPSTQSLGGAASGRSGGFNPIQFGTGVFNQGTAVDFSQGSLSNTGNGSTLALQGPGLFILEGPSQERLYSRNRNFKINSFNELVGQTGNRVLGYQADTDFSLNRNKLGALKIPLGKQFSAGNGNVRTLTDFQIESDGIIQGKFSDGSRESLGQIQVATFSNPGGLIQAGNNSFVEGNNSGVAVTADPGSAGAAQIVSGAEELSNVDVGQSLIELTEAETLARSSLRVIETSISLFDAMLNISRPR